MTKFMKIKLLTSAFVLGMIAFQTIPAEGQDLDALLEKETKPQVTYATATFKSTRIINGHSVERMKKNQLEFRVSHRFGEINSGSYNFWGIDQGTIHLSLEYGLTDWLELGIGRSTYEKNRRCFCKSLNTKTEQWREKYANSTLFRDKYGGYYIKYESGDAEKFLFKNVFCTANSDCPKTK